MKIKTSVKAGNLMGNPNQGGGSTTASGPGLLPPSPPPVSITLCPPGAPIHCIP
jgi:hypothetical protein